ncbi:hypothetical protein [Niastella vici]|nr:hypothetical protein [Niastella vici]
MPQYVVHKIGFFFTDENYEIEQERGNLVAISKSLEEAKATKFRADIESMKSQADNNAVIFYLENPNYEAITKKLTTYYNSEFGQFTSRIPPILLPYNMTDEQAAQFLSIMELTFHTIVEYGDDEVIDAAAFDLNNDEYCWF